MNNYNKSSFWVCLHTAGVWGWRVLMWKVENTDTADMDRIIITAAEMKLPDLPYRHQSCPKELMMWHKMTHQSSCCFFERTHRRCYCVVLCRGINCDLAAKGLLKGSNSLFFWKSRSLLNYCHVKYLGLPYVPVRINLFWVLLLKDGEQTPLSRPCSQQPKVGMEKKTLLCKKCFVSIKTDLNGCWTCMVCCDFSCTLSVYKKEMFIYIQFLFQVPKVDRISILQFWSRQPQIP